MKRFSRLGFDIWPKEKHTRIPPSGEGRNLEGVAAKMRHLKSQVSGLILPAPSPPSTHPSISFPISGEAVASLGFIFNSANLGEGDLRSILLRHGHPPSHHLNTLDQCF